MQNKIIIYGVRQIGLRRDIDFFLDNNWKVMGCSDGHYQSDVIDGMPFFGLGDLKSLDFSYVLLLSYRENTLTEMKQDLLAAGVPEEKIIKPVLFLQGSAYKNQIDLIEDIRANYHGEAGLIFGACYTMRDLEKRSLSFPFYDCGYHALDLYYNYQVLRYMSNHNMLSRVERTMFLFSYYCFNYDMSRTLPQYKEGRIFPAFQLHDWHHYREVPGAGDYVVNFELFGEKTFRFYRARRFEYKNPHVYSGADGAAQLNRTWFDRYDDTIAENKAIFKKFIDLHTDHGMRLDLVIPPYYLGGVDEKSQTAFNRMKDIYYEIVREICDGKENVRVFDYANIYAEKREYFSDIIHLNSAGAEAFTKRINQDVLKLR